MGIQIKMSDTDHILLNVWTDKWDEKKQKFVEKVFSIHVKEGYLFLTDNHKYPMEIKKGRWSDKKTAPPGQILKHIAERALRRKSQFIDMIYIKLED